MLLQAIDQGLSIVIPNESAGLAVRWHMRRITMNPQAVSEVLRSIFGAQGAWLFEDAILRKLYEYVGEEYDFNDTFSFEEHVKHLQKMFSSKKSLPC